MPHTPAYDGGMRGFGRKLASTLLAIAALAGGCRTDDAGRSDRRVTKPPADLLVPRIVGEPWRIARNPDMGPYSHPEAQPVDFTIWQASDRTWQMVACVRKTKFPGSGRLLFRWETDDLTRPDWREAGVFLTSDARPEHKEGQLQAPHVLRVGGTYYMFYNSAGAAFVLRSADGKAFTQHTTPPGDVRFFPMNRDVMVFDNRARDGLFYAYYTWVRPSLYPDRNGHTVGVRTARGLEGAWSEPSDVGVGTASVPGDPFNFINAESPFVLFRDGHYYRWEQMKVFVSQNPLVWPQTELTTLTPGDDRALIAPEIIEADDAFFVAGYKYKDARHGIYMARLEWSPATAAAGTAP